MSREATFAARWLHEPQPINNQEVELVFSQPVGRYRPGGSSFWSPGCSSGRDMKGVETRVCMLSSPDGAGPRRCPEGQLSPRAGSMSPTQIAAGQLGCVFHTFWGGIDPWDLCFRPRIVGIAEIVKDSRPGDGNVSSWGAAGPRRCSEGQLSSRARSMSLSQ